MGEKQITKKYSHTELTILWQPHKCIHSGVCVKLLPEVYDPNKRPWITPEQASGKALKEQIDRCPSGALSYETPTLSADGGNEKEAHVQVEVIANGPLLVKGMLEVTLTQGRKEKRTRATAFCRCGSSSDKPYCDGSHKTVSFKG